MRREGSTEVGTSETVSVPKAGTIRGSVALAHPRGQAEAQAEAQADAERWTEINASSTNKVSY